MCVQLNWTAKHNYTYISDIIRNSCTCTKIDSFSNWTTTIINKSLFKTTFIFLDGQVNIDDLLK